MNRWPAVALLVACLGLLVFADQRERPDAGEAAVIARSAMPVASSEGSFGSTWYCPGGIITPDAATDHILVITNPNRADAQGALTIYPALFDAIGTSVSFDPHVQPLDVPGRTQQRIALSAIVPDLDPEGRLATPLGAFAGALIEFADSGVIVEHAVSAPQGADTGPCASTAAPRWHFASGTTTRNVRDLLFLLNPFPDDAVVDVSFATDEGQRVPNKYNPLLVPSQGLVVIDVSEEVTVRPQVSTLVSARAGGVVAERVQVFGDTAEGPVGVSTALGVSDPQLQWFFPAGRSFEGAGESYVIYNPNDTAAEIEFEINIDNAEQLGDLAPVPIDVPPNQRIIMLVDDALNHPTSALATVDASARLPDDQRYWVSVRSFNSIPVVVERIVTVPGGEVAGVTATVGAPLAATEQRVLLPIEFGDPSPTLAIVNPAGDTISQVTVWSTVGDTSEIVAELELAPRRRGALELGPLLPMGAQSVRVESSTPVVAELAVIGPAGATSTLAIPSADAASQPDLFAFE